MQRNSLLQGIAYLKSIPQAEYDQEIHCRKNNGEENNKCSTKNEIGCVCTIKFALKGAG